MSRSAFEPYVRGQLVGAVRAGATLSDACRHAEVPENTVRGWLKRGRKELNTEYAAFEAEISTARTEAAADTASFEEALVLLSRAARAGSVRACQLLLEHHRSERERQEDEREPSIIDELIARRAARDRNGHAQ